MTLYSANATLLLTVNIGGNVSVSSGTLEFGRLTNSLPIQTLSIAGTTTVSGGTLRMAGANTGSLVANGNVTVNGGKLSMDSTGAGQTLNLGTGADFAMSAGTLLLTYTSAVSYDQIVGSTGSQFALSGGIIDLNNNLWDYSANYQIFSGFDSGAVAGLSFINYDTSYTPSLDNSGVLAFAAIPEPSTWLLTIAGLGAVIAFARRGKKLAV